MKKYYYNIVYQTCHYGPVKTEIYHGTSVSDAKLYAYSTLKAYHVFYTIKTTKNLIPIHKLFFK